MHCFEPNKVLVSLLQSSRGFGLGTVAPQHSKRFAIYREIMVVDAAAFPSFGLPRRIRQVARHCDRLFPEDLAATGVVDPAIAAATLREKFTVLRRKNERKRLASQLELKMRAIYYDVIDPAAVEGYIAAIYEQVGLKTIEGKR